MKSTVLILVLLLLVACTPQISTQQQIIEKTPNIIVQKNVTINLTNQNITTKATVKTNVSNQTAKNIIRRTVNGTTHIIEVVDVTEDSRSCLIKVDGKTYVVNKDEPQKINGVKITVLEVYVFHDVLENKDMCQLFVS